MTVPKSYDGLAPFNYPAALKPLETYYKVFGNLKSGFTPLVLIHGGPGMSHDYLLNHSFLTEHYGIPIILYDQIGSGRSTHLPETAKWKDFWTDAIFLAQLTQLVGYLGAGDDYAILGSSWGGMMGSRFASQRPKGLKKVILANAPVNQAAAKANLLLYKRALPQEIQDTLRKHEEAGTTSSPEYSAIMTQWVKDHVCNLESFPEEALISIKYSEEDLTVIQAVGDDGPWGATPGSYMASWDTSEDVKNIEVPTLVINGVGEVASGNAVRPFLEGIPDVRGITLEGTTHSPNLEDKERYMKVVGEFLVGKS